MQVETITIDVVMATSLDPFIDENKKRIIGYHYFHKCNGNWWFSWVQEDTDGKLLLEQINNKEIYIFK